ncbi:dodecin family protein [Thermopirellula anaerolimosa]
MAEPVFKKLQVVGTSTVSFADAAAQAVAKVAQTEKKASWFEVVELRGAIADGKVSQYQVTVNIGCKLD